MRHLILFLCVMFAPVATADLTLIYETPHGRLHYYVKDGQTYVRMPEERPIVYVESANELRVLDREAREYHVMTSRALQAVAERRARRAENERFDRTNTFTEINGLMTRRINYSFDGRAAGTFQAADRERLGIADADWKTLQATLRALHLADPMEPDLSRVSGLVVERRDSNNKRQMVLSVLLNAPISETRIPTAAPEWKRIEISP